MKVLVIGLNYAPEPTGIAPYTTSFSRGLVLRGNKVRVLTTMPHYPEWRIRRDYGGWRRRELIDGVLVDRLRHYVPARPDGIRRLLSELTFGMRSVGIRWGKPDVVLLVSPGLFSSGIALIRATLMGVPAVLWVQDIYSLGIVETQGLSKSSRVVSRIAATESAILRNASAVSVIHRRFANVVERLGVPKDGVLVVRNWMHLSERRPAARAGIRVRLGWADEDIIVLHSGAMGRKQDLDNVVSAARISDAQGTAVRFVLMGDGSERARLENSARGVRALQFMDPLPGREFQDALTAADLLLVNEHAGLREMAVPSKLTSYFSSGRPILAATDSGSVTAEEVDASGGGVRVEPGRPDLLVDAAVDLGRDVERSRLLGVAGRAYQRRVLSEQSALDNYSAWLEQVVLGYDGDSLLGRLKSISGILGGMVFSQLNRDFRPE